MNRCIPLLFAVSLPILAAEPSLNGFDEFVDQALKTWKVPGAAVAVVKDGKVILSKGYGVRDIRNNLPVTPKTMFAIGSSTKSFTVLSLGALVDDGKLDWDKPVREYMPDFRLYDKVATEEMTPRDLVTHRSGLPRHDLMWYNSPYSRKEIYQRLRYLEPSAEFRATWQYQNLMFMTAGYLASQVAGQPWEALVKERIFGPLGMTSSNFSVADMQKSADYAKPYQKVKEDVVEMAYRNIDTIGPAGSINSTVEDMANYVIMHLSNGMFNGKQIIGANTVRDMQTPQMVIPGPVRWNEAGHQSYGMGTFIQSYRGEKIVHHGGNIDGFSALFSFMPSKKLGIVILTNMNGTPLPNLISYAMYDRMLGLEPVDWTARLKSDEALQKASAAEAEKRKLTPQKPNTKPSHPIADYAGDYENPAYGIITVNASGEALSFDYHNLGGPLRHFHYDVFECAAGEGKTLDKVKLQFLTSLNGDIDRISIPIESSVQNIVFTRRGDKQMYERSFLEPFTGAYKLGPQTMSIALRGENMLLLNIGGQPPRELVPSRGTTFLIKGMNGFSLEFKKGDNGSNDLVFYQPNGTFVAKKQ